MSLRHALIAVALPLLGITAANATPYDQIIVFGDDNSDVGNFWLASGKAWPAAPNYYEGRFTNALVWVEHLASLYGVGMTANTDPKTPGTDYAWAYAHVLEDYQAPLPTGVGQPFRVPKLSEQVNQYLSDAGGKADPNALYVIWGGEADVIDAVENSTPLHVPKFGEAFQTMVSKLKAAGATNFLIPTVPDVQYLPEIVALGLAKAAHGQAHLYNVEVNSILAEPSLAAGITVNRPNIWRLQLSINQAPTHYNFTDTTDACLTPPTNPPPAVPTTVCPDPASYLYLDGRHFTGWLHAMLAGTTTNLIPQARSVPF